jgi:hypothetical protein
MPDPRARATASSAPPVERASGASDPDVLTDLRSRSAEEIHGPRWVWTVLPAVNIVGPIAYFAFGRRSTVPAAERRPPTECTVRRALTERMHRESPFHEDR